MNPGDDTFREARLSMVREQFANIAHARVLDAMRLVPRHEFVPSDVRDAAYDDRPLPIGFGQTISQPYVVALMTAALNPQPADRVLEIGTGSGYQSAVLAQLVAQVNTIEIIPSLAERATSDLERLGCKNIFVRAGDGYKGWPEAPPFDCIIVTCAPENVPPPLVEQLRDNGRMIIPVGPTEEQQLILLRRRGNLLEKEAVLAVRFVPMTGEAQRRGAAVPNGST